MTSTAMPAETTVYCRVSVSDPFGLHGRPAARLVRTASQFDADVRIHSGNDSANAKSLISVLTLGAAQGEDLTVIARGADAKGAVQAIATLFPRSVPVEEMDMVTA